MRIAAIAVALAACAFVAPDADPPRAARVLFTEEFDGDRLDGERWRTCHWWSDGGCTIATNDEFEWYVPGQVAVGGGIARLTAERGRDPDGDRRHRFLSGMLSTGPGPERAPRFAFRYGRASMRARLPEGDGLWPAFWMLPADRRSEPEIDIFEVTSDEPETVDASLHLRRAGRERSLRRSWDGLRDGWHTFTMDWRRGRLEWLVDGERIWLVEGDRVPDERMYLVANLAVSGDPPPSRDTPSPASLEIDWVRVTR